MNCAIKLKGYEVAGSTFQDRKFIFTDRDISGDVFTAVVYNSFSKKNNIEGLKNGNEVFFPYSTLEKLKTGRYRIEFWATMAGIGKEMIALEEFFISSDPSCTNGSNETNVSITFKEEVINFTIQTALMYGGAIKWVNIEDKPEEFPPSAHTHQWDKIEGKPTVFYDDTEIKEEIAKKVDKVAGKGLSDNNYSTADKTKLDNINLSNYVLQSNLNTQLQSYATLNGVQTFNGTKTFTEAPIVPTATLNGQAVNLGQLNAKFLPYTGATKDLQLVDKNLYLQNGQIQFYGNAKLYHGIPTGASAGGLILWGYDGIEFANRSFYSSPTIFTMNGVEKARVQYNGDFKNEGALFPKKGIVVNEFSPIVKQVGSNNTENIILIKTGQSGDSFVTSEFKVNIQCYEATGMKHYEFIVSNYFVKGTNKGSNIGPSITWVAGDSNDIAAIKLYTKEVGFDSYVTVEGNFKYPRIAITELQSHVNTIHPDLWGIYVYPNVDLTGKTLTHTFLPKDFKRDTITKEFFNAEPKTFVSATASSIANNTIFVDSADGKLKFKDGNGVLNNLY